MNFIDPALQPAAGRSTEGYGEQQDGQGTVLGATEHRSAPLPAYLSHEKQSTNERVSIARRPDRLVGTSAMMPVRMAHLAVPWAAQVPVLDLSQVSV